MAEWVPDLLYRRISDEMLIDPLPLDELRDDHDVTPIDPGWFLSFDQVDSRKIRTTGAPA